MSRITVPLTEPLTKQIVPRLLTADAFRAFGEIICIPDNAVAIDINSDTCLRYDGLGHIDVEGESGISIFKAQARQSPFNIELLERHPLGSQAFVPLGEVNYIVVVAPDKNNMPDWNNLQAFYTTQGINFYRNIWHHPLITTEKQSDFLVIDRLSSNKGNNLEEASNTPIQIIF